MTDPPDEGAKSARNEAVAGIFEEHRAGLEKFARGRGANDPEDTTDEAFLQLVIHWDQLHHTHKALAWMRTVVRRLTCKQFRDLERLQNMIRILGLDLAATQAESDLVLNEDQRAVLDAVRALSQRQRDVILLRFWFGLSVAEIAHKLSIKEKTVRTHDRRAKARLKKALGEFE